MKKIYLKSSIEKDNKNYFNEVIILLTQERFQSYKLLAMKI